MIGRGTRLAIAIAAAAWAASHAAPAVAQFRDSFEGPEPTWLLRGADCGVKQLAHLRDYRQSHAGQASEHIRLAVGEGTFVYLVLPIGKAPVIAEFTGSIAKSGHYKGGNALQPTNTATTVRVRNAKRTATDGPFAETREQLGGYYLVDAKDLDEAIGLAARSPGALTGAIEVRPIMEMPAPVPA